MSETAGLLVIRAAVPADLCERLADELRTTDPRGTTSLSPCYKDIALQAHVV
jgi:hypothetical protein